MYKTKSELDKILYTKENANKKKSQGNIGKLKLIVDKNGSLNDDKREYKSIDQLKNMLISQNSKFYEDQTLPDNIITKTYIKFYCAKQGCSNVHSKQIRDITVGSNRGGPYCKECTAENKSRMCSGKNYN